MKPEKKALELNENEKIIYDLLSKESPQELSSLKAAAGLSNKAWDKGIKGLTKINAATVSKTDEGLFVTLS